MGPRIVAWLGRRFHKRLSGRRSAAREQPQLQPLERLTSTIPPASAGGYSTDYHAIGFVACSRSWSWSTSSTESAPGSVSSPGIWQSSTAMKFSAPYAPRTSGRRRQSSARDSRRSAKQRAGNTGHRLPRESPRRRVHRGPTGTQGNGGRADSRSESTGDDRPAGPRKADSMRESKATVCSRESARRHSTRERSARGYRSLRVRRRAERYHEWKGRGGSHETIPCRDNL